MLLHGQIEGMLDGCVDCSLGITARSQCFLVNIGTSEKAQ